MRIISYSSYVSTLLKLNCLRQVLGAVRVGGDAVTEQFLYLLLIPTSGGENFAISAYFHIRNATVFDL